MLLDDFDFSALDIDTVVENSYKDFHAKGLDYICLHRSPEYTLKVYFFEGGAQEASEVVNPHDHRYSFDTECLAGAVRNKWFHGSRCAKSSSQTYNMFAWYTPLLGGEGFVHRGEVQLSIRYAATYKPGASYSMRSSEFHTIQIAAQDTAIVIAQYEDELPDSFPTLTFTKSSQPPDLAGLYNKFTADQVVRKIGEIEQLARSQNQKGLCA